MENCDGSPLLFSLQKIMTWKNCDASSGEKNRYVPGGIAHALFTRLGITSMSIIMMFLPLRSHYKNSLRSFAPS